LIADILCRVNRISTCYLGASHPAHSLAEAINALKSETLVMGVLSSDQWDYKKNIIQYLKNLDNDLNTKIKVILGGGFEIDFPQFKNIEKVITMKNFEDFDALLTSTDKHK
jgi:methanogenic corrinoid protein MtbC1